MDLNFFKDKKITVLGLGLHGGGVGIVKFLANHGAKVVVTDLKTKEQLAPSLKELEGLKNVEYVLGQHRQEDFTNTGMVIKNPAVPWDNPHVKLALEKKVPVEMDSSLFFKLCKNKIIGVTGTKGKTTTAALIYEILKLAGKNPVRAGSGQVSVLDKLDILKKDSIVVFELSSWRLSALKKEKMSPHIAVITNILRDHQNYYKSMEDYIADKKNIFLFQKPTDWLVFNDDNEKLKEIYPEVKSQVLKFSFTPAKDAHSIFVENDTIYVNNGVDTKKIIEIKDIKIPGKHNVYNIMAAIGATFAFGISPEEIKKAIANFPGVPHRMEFVREFNGVKYYNDTTATIPDAVLASIKSFNAPIILIAGGEDKKLDFGELGKEILKYAKKIVFLKGSGSEKLIEEIKKSNPEQEFNFPICGSMEEAVNIAKDLTEEGDMILLSPGAASFNLFLNEFDRGDKFKAAVEKLK
ncbi:MAG: UDP-N-acetylmuramoyl-L-alanine--D-glutamate ligase [Patescibacteria group bacterium]